MGLQVPKAAGMSSARGVYVYYPRGVRTGGPEALHQLVDSLSRQGFSAYLVPTPWTREAADVREYAHYQAPIAATVPAFSECTVVVPETFPELLLGHPKAHKVIWWLSIENSPLYRQTWLRREHGVLGTPYLRAVAKQAIYAGRARSIRTASRSLAQFEHCAQSAYAWARLMMDHGIQSSRLTDYTRLASADGADVGVRERSVVAYNASKGQELVHQVRAIRPQWNWVGIQGMAPSQVAETLQTATVYLDLGHHPGRDRMPREAATSGAVVVVGLRGAAILQADLPIPESHKLLVNPFHPERIASRLDSILEDSSSAYSAQAGYRNWILDEPSRFHQEVVSFFRDGRREGFGLS